MATRPYANSKFEKSQGVIGRKVGYQAGSFSIPSPPPLVGISDGIEKENLCGLDQLKWALEWVNWYNRGGRMEAHPSFNEPPRATSQRGRRLGKKFREWQSERQYEKEKR